MKIIEHSTIAAREQLGRILSEFCVPEFPSAGCRPIVEPFDGDGLKLTLIRLVQTGLDLASERWDYWRIDGDGRVVFHDYEIVSYEPVID